MRRVESRAFILNNVRRRQKDVGHSQFRLGEIEESVSEDDVNESQVKQSQPSNFGFELKDNLKCATLEEYSSLKSRMKNSKLNLLNEAEGELSNDNNQTFNKMGLDTKVTDGQPF